MGLRDYIDYMRDNPDGYWFKKKLYGWGWVPVRWQGWAVTLLFVAYLLFLGLGLSQGGEPSNLELEYFFVKIVVAIVAIVVICFLTGEKPSWQWGLK